MVLETHVKLCMKKLDFLEKIFLPQKWSKKQFFLNLLENAVISFY